MYTLPNKLKIFALVLMVVGAIGVFAGFMNSPGSVEEVKERLENQDYHGHGAAHGTDEVHHDDAHYEHVYHQLKNRPWSAVYVAAFFFFMISLGALAFYAVQHASQAGWSPVLFRVMEGVTGYLLPGSIVMMIIFILASSHVTDIFHWMEPSLVDPNHENYDALIANKSGWLNTTTFLIRAFLYILGWNLYRHFSRKFTLKQDEAEPGNYTWFKKNFKLSAGFLVFFIVTESMMSWDWIMGFDPHWFSTLFGWYVFAGMFVSGITVIAMVTIYLKSQGYLEFVNSSHIHDLAKFMFAISIFWTYLWFSQFMLYWYANIPEEVTYFIARIQDYKLLFFGMVVLNFVLPLLLLVNTDFKRVHWLVIFVGIIILAGHYLDVFVMVMPGTVSASWSIGLPEIGALLFFAGLFIFVVFTTLSKAPLLAKGSPFIEESKHFHY